MKKDIHPEYVDTLVTCTCGNSFHTRSTLTTGEMRVDVCSACHPFYTGKQKILDTGGRVAMFEAVYVTGVRPPKCGPHRWGFVRRGVRYAPGAEAYLTTQL